MAKFRHYFTAIASIALTASVWAEIRETNSMVQALSNLNETDVVVLDIDNTILETRQTLGSDQWYGHLVKSNRQMGYSETEAIDFAIERWLAVQELTEVSPVETVTPGLIQQAQAKARLVLALTARPIKLKTATHQQLKSIGVEFQNQHLVFGNQSDVELSQGVLFVGPKQNKGQVLSQFLKAMNIEAKRVIFVDDKLHHTQTMEVMFAQAGTQNINFRYSAVDAKVAAFRSDIAEVQWEYFVDSGGVIISDQRAQLIIDQGL